MHTFWDAAEAVLRGGAFIVLQAYLKKQEKILNLNKLHLKELEKEPTNPKISRREIVMIRAAINEIETKKKNTKEHETNKTKSCSLER